MEKYNKSFFYEEEMWENHCGAEIWFKKLAQVKHPPSRYVDRKESYQHNLDTIYSELALFSVVGVR